MTYKELLTHSHKIAFYSIMQNTIHNNQASPPLQPQHTDASTTHLVAPAPDLLDTGNNGLGMHHVRHIHHSLPFGITNIQQLKHIVKVGLDPWFTAKRRDLTFV